VSIRERPAAVEDRAVPGHWEGGARLEAGTLARTAFEELKAFMTRHGV
jgi:IS30 family transposase